MCENLAQLMAHFLYIAPENTKPGQNCCIEAVCDGTRDYFIDGEGNLRVI